MTLLIIYVLPPIIALLTITKEKGYPNLKRDHILVFCVFLVLIILKINTSSFMETDYAIATGVLGVLLMTITYPISYFILKNRIKTDDERHAELHREVATKTTVIQDLIKAENAIRTLEEQLVALEYDIDTRLSEIEDKIEALQSTKQNNSNSFFDETLLGFQRQIKQNKTNIDKIAAHLRKTAHK